MMTTCRLLYALLVLALCCCPSVCAADNHADVQEPSKSTTTNTATQSPKDNEKVIVQPDGKGSSSSSSATVGLQGKDQSDSLGLVPVGDKGTKAGAGPAAATPEKQSNDQNIVVNAEGKKGTTESQSGTSSSPENENNKAEDAPTKTTTTTQALTTKVPITSTTTTTTTQAPSTTTTEAPTTTTTRAPSRLREVDSSLSSSAWVCAPLLLAASALAYTAVG
ncbi:putative mucin TcMUCII [Trypanosoma cruzi]|nr:putative mucin TcMUCII [Trypanosoma cruzi]